MTLLVQGIEIGTDDVKGLRTCKGAKVTGDFLFHLGVVSHAIG